jgi:2-C-methyl-D-erythritol 2,4-cyclodiphosphate synthase
MQLRIGHGFDVHAFGDGDHIVLGGVRIPHGRGFVAHSDGDVLIHALCDALLGAAGLGDIGRHFPDTDPAYRGIDSRILLRKVVESISGQGWSIANADHTIIAQAPRLGPHVETMRQHLAEDLDITVEQINVKATTTERLGYLGREEGIAVHAVVLLQSSPEGPTYASRPMLG